MKDELNLWNIKAICSLHYQKRFKLIWPYFQSCFGEFPGTSFENIFFLLEQFFC